MFLRRDGLPAHSANHIKGDEKVQKNLVKLTEQLNFANQQLAIQMAENERLESAMRRAEHRYSSLFDNSVVGIFQILPDGYYSLCNRALLKIYGYEEDTQLLTKLTELGGQLYVEPIRRQELREKLHLYNAVSEFESQVYRRDGTIIWISENVEAVRDEDGALLYYEGFVTDITKLKSVEVSWQQSVTQLREKEQQLKLTSEKLRQTQAYLMENEKLASLGKLFACVSHEINNPVNFVYGNLTHASQYAEDLINVLNLYTKHYPQPVPEIKQLAEEIDQEFLVEDFPKTLSSMQLGADRIRQIVKSLRTFSRPDQAEIQPVEIHELIDSTLLIINRRLQPGGDNPGITLIKDYGELPLVNCYDCLLSQVFINLLCNAIDALEENSILTSSVDSQKAKQTTNTIFIQTAVVKEENQPKDKPNSKVVIRIADNGPGISEEVQSRLFDPFFTTKPVGKGTGLGLAISHQIIVEKHEGQLKCISTKGQGTEFIIEIPLR
ncbi:MAG: ATP-binding protein [Coleofasciculaceae cyanobacterium]